MPPARPRLLVVEDDAEIRAALTTLLGEAGYAVDTAANGACAVERIKQGNLDLVLLDLGLPEVNGVDICFRRKAGAFAASINPSTTCCG